MTRQLFVSGSVTLADDGSVSGSLSLWSGDNTPAGSTPEQPAAPEQPAPAPDQLGQAGQPDQAGQPGQDQPDQAGQPGPDQPDQAGQPADGGAADPTTAGAEAGTTADTAAGPGPGTDTPATDTATGSPAGPPYPGRELHRDDTQQAPDTDLRAFQQAATDRGYTVGPVDGYFGPRTENAVRALQTANGLEPNGVIDADTWAAAFTTSAA